MKQHKSSVQKKELKMQQEAVSSEDAKKLAVAAMAGNGAVPKKELKDNSAPDVAPDRAAIIDKAEEEERGKFLAQLSVRRMIARRAREAEERAARDREQEQAKLRAAQASDMFDRVVGSCEANEAMLSYA